MRELRPPRLPKSRFHVSFVELGIPFISAPAECMHRSSLYWILIFKVAAYSHEMKALHDCLVDGRESGGKKWLRKEAEAKRILILIKGISILILLGS